MVILLPLSCSDHTLRDTQTNYDRTCLRGGVVCGQAGNRSGNHVTQGTEQVSSGC